MASENDDPEAVSHCPNCGADYRAGFTKCSDCGVDLVLGPAPETGAEPAPAKKLDFYQEQDMRNFGRTFDMFDQEEGKPVAIAVESEPDLGLLIGKLESEGIGARPGLMDMSSFPRGVFGAIGPLGMAMRTGERWVVLVREQDSERAKGVYEAFAKIQNDVRYGTEGEAPEDLARRSTDETAPDDEDPDASSDDAWAAANRRIWGTPAEK